MKINDIIYIVTPVEMHGKTVPYSAQILKARVVEILPNKLVAEIEVGEGRYKLTEVKEPYYTTVHDAMPALEILMKPNTKFIKEEEYNGEDIDITNLNISNNTDIR